MIEVLLGFGRPSEVAVFSSRACRGHSFFLESRQEPTKCGDTPNQSLYPLEVLDWAHVSDGLYFSRLTLIPRSDTMKPRSFPLGNPKMHFSGFNLIRNLWRLANVSSRSVMRSSDFWSLQRRHPRRPPSYTRLGQQRSGACTSGT
jgi:hypothetical protein